MTTHLDALRLRLSNERVRLANAKTAGEREMRSVWAAGIEKEIQCEMAGKFSDTLPNMTDDELLAALEA